MRNALALFLGAFFGLVLVKSEVASWFRIQKMFRFEEAHMYLIIGSAVGVGALSLLLIKWVHRMRHSQPLEVKGKTFTKGTVAGGFAFGIGWAVTGACPGPIYAQIGKGEYLAVLSFAGAFLGAFLYAWLRPRLPH